MKFLLSVFTGCVFFVSVLVSCGTQNVESDVAVVSPKDSLMDVDSLLTRAEALVDKKIAVEGICTHICAHGGGKIFLMGSDDTKTIRIEGGEVGRFDAKCVNNLVKITGLVREQRIDEAYLQSWEAQIEAETEEKHGEEEEEGGCSTEKKARNETGNSSQERIAAFRAKIAEREKKDGKAYLSFFFIEASNYSISQ